MKIFAINFAMGVVTGIPMEFQFGTNWARFSKAAGGVIGQTLAMEGVFSFFLESTFLGLFVFGEKRLSPRMHWFSALTGLRWVRGSPDSSSSPPMPGCSIPPATRLARTTRSCSKASGDLLLNPWILWQYLHNMIAAVVTGSFVMASIGAYYLLAGAIRGTRAHFRPDRRDRRNASRPSR